jgi:hypothetical protein
MTAPDLQRDGGPFTDGAACPWCGVCDVHPMRVPNPQAPPGRDPFDPLALRAFAQGGVLGLPRWDERPFDVVRTCTGCGYEFGQR